MVPVPPCRQNTYTHTHKHIKFKMPKETFNNRRKQRPNVDKDSRIVVMWSQIGIIGRKKRPKMSIYEGLLSMHGPVNTLVLDLWLKNHMGILAPFFFRTAVREK